MSDVSPYDEADFLTYVFREMNIEILSRNGNYFQLAGGFAVEVEKKDLYKLSHDNWVISPFNDAGKLCAFIKASLEHPENE